MQHEIYYEYNQSINNHKVNYSINQKNEEIKFNEENEIELNFTNNDNKI